MSHSKRCRRFVCNVLNCSAGVKIDARALCIFLPRDLAISPVDKEYKRALVVSKKSIANGLRGEKDLKNQN